MTEPCLNSPCMVTLQDTQPLKQSATNFNEVFLFLLDYLKTPNRKKKTNALLHFWNIQNKKEEVEIVSGIYENIQISTFRS